MSRATAYLQLVRLPALPTALADIGLGALVTDSLPERGPTVALLLLSSGCLYCSGMAWNDYFDVEQDRRERPERPIPSGRVERATAGRFATGLMVLGVVAAALGDSVPTFLSTKLALLLVGAILLYDGWLKRTPLGPASMGLCRALNVLLGLSAGGTLNGGEGWHLAGVVGLYIVGVTWFARTEARQSQRAQLAGATGVMLAALLLALPMALHRPPGSAALVFPYLLAALGFYLGVPLVRAIQQPAPHRVQRAVRRCLMGLIVLDAALATALVGAVGLVLLVLLAPAMILARRRRLYAT